MTRLLALITLLLSPWLGLHLADAVEVPLIGSYSAVQTLTAGTSINCEAPNLYRTVRVQGSGGAVDLTASPQITAGVAAGQRCTICGAHATNTVKLDDGTGVDLSSNAASLILVDDPTVAQVCADFVWTGAPANVWRQTISSSGADNQTADEVPLTPFGTIAATDVQAGLEELFAEVAGGGITYHTDATSCPGNKVAADGVAAGDVCLDLDDGQYWRCNNPAIGDVSSSATLCDDTEEWVGGKPIFVDATGTLTYALSDTGTNHFQICNAATVNPTCHRWSITAAGGPLYQGVCAGSSCTTDISVANTEDMRWFYDTVQTHVMPAGKNLFIPTANGWIGVRSGTATPDATACNEASEVGNLYVETDQPTYRMLHVCDSDLAWKQQGIGVSEKCATIENVLSTDNLPIGSFAQPVTITSVWCHYMGSAPTTAATFTLAGGVGGAMTIAGTNPTCVASSSVATAAAVTSNTASQLSAREVVILDVSNTPNPLTTTYQLCVSYTVD